jgi:lantibiotic biosynthesis protein
VAGVLAGRRRALMAFAPEIAAARASAGLTPARGEICRSYIHMHCNRVLELGSPLEPIALALARRTRETLTHLPG